MGDTPKETGAEMIAAERLRQVDAEGWTAEHDDAQHFDGELRDAALAYLQFVPPFCNDDIVPSAWPWGWDDFKPSDDPIRTLVKAGALIAAEIDRWLRASDGEREK